MATTPDCFNLRDCLHQVAESRLSQACNQHPAISILIAEELPQHLSDNIAKFREHVSRLLDTALRESPAGPVELEARLIGQHDGQIEISLITHSEGTSASETIALQAPQNPSQHNPEHTQPKILVVDDNEINVKLAEHILHKGGYTVEWATSGKQALAKLAQDRFELILMDIHMPEMDGFQTTKRIREREQNEAIPIIAITADTIQGYREQCVAAGMNGYLPKPYSKDELLAEVKQLLTASSPSAEHKPSTQRSISDQQLPMSDGKEWLNFERVLATMQNDRALLTKMAHIFDKRSNELLANMQDALAAHQFDELASLAHTIKGTISNFTNSGPFETASRIEQLAANQDYKTLVEQLHILRQEVSELKHLFQTSL